MCVSANEIPDGEPVDSSFRRRHGTDGHHEVDRRHIAGVLDSVLIVRGCEAGGAGTKLVLLAVERQLYCPFFDQPELAVRMLVRRMRGAPRIQSGLMNLYTLSRGCGAVHDRP